jgi:hypothetical protein
VSSGVGGVSGRAGGEVRGWVGLLDGLGVRPVSESGWGWSGWGVIDLVIFGCDADEAGWWCSICFVLDVVDVVKS